MLNGRELHGEREVVVGFHFAVVGGEAQSLVVEGDGVDLVGAGLDRDQGEPECGDDAEHLLLGVELVLHQWRHDAAEARMRAR